MSRLSLALTLLSTIATQAAEPTLESLKPLMLIPDKAVIQDDFSKAGPISKDLWQARQGTQWVIEEGVLRGKPSSAEFQASKKDHAGLEPRIAAPTTPKECVASFSVRFIGGEETNLVPLVEFGHHVCRLHFSEAITELLAEHDSLRVNEAKGFRYQPGTWYHMLWELKGDEVVIQIAGGPTLYAKHASYAAAPGTGAAGLGVAGPRNGTVEIDNVTISAIKPGTLPTWEAAKKKLPDYQPVPLPKKGKGKKAA